MITQMEVISTQPDIPELPLGGFVLADDNPVQVRNIDGLGPAKGEISSTPFSTGRGSLFQGSSTSNRNIVLTLGLNPNWATQTITSLRQLLYRYFMTEQWTELRFLSDELPEVHIKGVVESVEPNIFSQDPEMQISIICPKPDFIDLEPTMILAGTAVSIVDVDFDALNFYNMDVVAEPDMEYIDYIGTAPTGFELRIEIPGTYTGQVAVINATPDGVQYLKMTGVSIDSTQRFELNTVRSLRSVYNVLTGTEDAINILAKVSKDSDWPEFFPGANKFAVYSSPDLTSATLPWTLGYFNRFGGL